MPGPKLINIDFGGPTTTKTGGSLLGTAGDVWNSAGPSNWPIDYTVSNLRWSDGQSSTISMRALNLQGLWVVGVEVRDGALMLGVRPRSQGLTGPRCGHRKRGRFSSRIRCWRHVAIWGQEVWLEGPIRRMRCPRCEAVVTEAVEWARHGSEFTRVFEDVVALCQRRRVSAAFWWHDGWRGLSLVPSAYRQLCRRRWE